MQQKGLTLPDLLEKIAHFIPFAWQYPESACAKILYEGQVYASSDFKETKWRQIAYITIADKRTGSIEVCYREEKKQEDEGPFLLFERKLIESIAELLAETIERRNAEEDASTATPPASSNDSTEPQGIDGR